MVPRLFRVEEAWPETSDVTTLALSPAEGPRLAFEAGQFNMLYAFGIGEIAVSISGDPGGSDGMLHSIRNVGAVSAALTGLSAGDMLGVRGPFGTPWPVAAQRGREGADEPAAGDVVDHQARARQGHPLAGHGRG